MKLVLRFSKTGCAVAALFLLLALAACAWIVYSAETNPGDSGEGGVLLLFFAMPWIQCLPRQFIGPFAAAACILFNGLLLYCLCGGLRLKRKA